MTTRGEESDVTRPATSAPTWTHELTYRGRGISSIMHRRRLQALLDIYRTIPIPYGAVVADFGCSNGFLLSVLWEEVFGDRVAHAHGFDHSEQLIEMARGRGLPRTHFDLVDLNAVGHDFAGRFDVVGCFETLEHVGNIENAFENLVLACRPGGIIVVSVPNELEIPGLVKYVGRRLLRRNAYGDFFEGRSEAAYVARLLTGRRIDVFRDPPQDSWGPHLGFDRRRLEDHIRRAWVDTGRLETVRASWAGLRFTRFLVYRRAVAGS